MQTKEQKNLAAEKEVKRGCLNQVNCEARADETLISKISPTSSYCLGAKSFWVTTNNSVECN